MLNAIAKGVPNLIGGSADLAPSNNTNLKDMGDFGRANPLGRNFHFGIREHGMGGICNGIAYHGGLRPFCATFMVFSDYMRPAIRLAAISKLPVIYIFTHDSIFVGEDGPTHEPVEHLAALRVIPNLQFLRPGDAEETEMAWRMAIREEERADRARAHTSGNRRLCQGGLRMAEDHPQGSLYREGLRRSTGCRDHCDGL